MNTLLMSPFAVRLQPNRNMQDFNKWVDRFITNEAIPAVKNVTNKLGSPLTNIKKLEDGYELMLAVPGFSKEQIKLSVDENTLSVEGTFDTEVKPDEKYNYKEFGIKSFKRSFILPENVDLDKITASSLNGVLSITIKEKAAEPKAQPKSISID